MSCRPFTTHVSKINGYAIRFYTLLHYEMCFTIMQCILSVIVYFTAQHLPYFWLIQRQKKIQFTKMLLHLCILFGTSQEMSLYVWGTSGGNLSFCTHSTRADSFSPWLIIAVGSHQFNPHTAEENTKTERNQRTNEGMSTKLQWHFNPPYTQLEVTIHKILITFIVLVIELATTGTAGIETAPKPHDSMKMRRGQRGK